MKLSQLILPPTPAPASSPSQIFSSLCSWTRACEQVIRILEKFLNGQNSVFSGTVAPNGVQTGSTGDIYNQVTAPPTTPALTKQWIKCSGIATSTGWV